MLAGGLPSQAGTSHTAAPTILFPRPIHDAECPIRRFPPFLRTQDLLGRTAQRPIRQDREGVPREAATGTRPVSCDLQRPIRLKLDIRPNRVRLDYCWCCWCCCYPSTPASDQRVRRRPASCATLPNSKRVFQTH